MDNLLAALIGSTGILVGVFAGAWRQAILQRNISQNEDLRRWQQERRESYCASSLRTMNFTEAS
jgi:hypothetical protein